MAGDDFGYYTLEVPGCNVQLGIRNKEKGCTYVNHNPRFKVDEDALPIGAALHVASAMRSMEEFASSCESSVFEWQRWDMVITE